MPEDMEKIMNLDDQKKEVKDISINDLREKVVKNAKEILSKKKGKNYIYGAKGPEYFDCSGLTYYVYKMSGLKIPEGSYHQSKYVGYGLKKEELKPGDLVFFNTTGKGVSHVGIYIGGDQFIDSGGGKKNNKNNKGEGVRISNLNDKKWKGKFLGGASLEKIAIENKIPLKNKEISKNIKKEYKREFEPSENTLFSATEKEDKKEVSTVSTRRNLAEIKAEMTNKIKEEKNENKTENDKKTKINIK